MTTTRKRIAVYSLAPYPLMEMGNVAGMGMPSRLAFHRELARMGFKVVYVQISGSLQEFPVDCEGVEVRQIRVPLIPQRGLIARSLSRGLNLPIWVVAAVRMVLPLLSEAKRAGERLVLYGHHQYGAVAASILGRILKVPNVTRLYGTLAPYIIGLSEQYPKSRLARLVGYLRVWEDILAVMMPADRYVITDDGTLGDKLFRHLKGDDPRLVFVRNGIDIDWNRALSEPIDDGIVFRLFGNAAPLVLSAGRLIQWKRMERIVEIARRVTMRGNAANFLILGNGDREATLVKAISEAGLASRVRILTGVPHREMPRYLRAATVVLLLQDYTNLSNTLLESLALEKPVVALDVGGTKSVLHNGWNGILVPLDGWEAATADAVTSVLASPELRAQLAQGCREWRDANAYDWRIRAQIDADLIRELTRDDDPGGRPSRVSHVQGQPTP